MATRLYFPLSGTAPSSPTVSADWEQSAAGFARFPLVTQRVGSALADANEAFGSVLTSQTCVRQFVSAPLASNQTIAGTFSIVVLGRENAGTANFYLACSVRVLQGDTSTERGVSLFKGTITGATEWGTAYRTRIWSAETLTSVDALAGDRIVVEVGWHGELPAVGASGDLHFGDNGATDLALTSNTGSLGENPWCEFSQTIDFADDLVAAGVGQAEASAALVGSGGVLPGAGGDSQASALLAGVGSLGASASGSADAYAALGGVGALEALSHANAEASAQAVGVGGLAAAAACGATCSAQLVADGALAAVCLAGADGQAALDGTGQLLAYAEGDTRQGTANAFTSNSEGLLLPVCQAGADASAAAEGSGALAPVCHAGAEGIATAAEPPARARGGQPAYFSRRLRLDRFPRVTGPRP